MFKFFPNPEFAWVFLASLVAILAVCAYVDWQRMVIPKWLTLPLLALGVVATLVRSAWLGAQGDPLWFRLPTGNVFLGLLDGLLFALVGFLVGFGMIFLMWILGTCGGGDVKLFAALGAWLGPLYSIYILAASLVVLFVEVVIKLVALGFSGKNLLKMAQANRAKMKKKDAAPPKEKWRITYSLPVAVATLAVLLWVFRAELRLAPPKADPNGSTQAHARG